MGSAVHRLELLAVGIMLLLAALVLLFGERQQAQMRSGSAAAVTILPGTAAVESLAHASAADGSADGAGNLARRLHQLSAAVRKAWPMPGWLGLSLLGLLGSVAGGRLLLRWQRARRPRLAATRQRCAASLPRPPMSGAPAPVAASEMGASTMAAPCVPAVAPALNTGSTPALPLIMDEAPPAGEQPSAITTPPPDTGLTSPPDLLPPDEPVSSEPHRSLAVQTLSARERDILRLVARGLNNREVGQQLGIVEPTVKRHMSNILAKLAAPDRAAAVAAARARGLL